MGGTLCQAITNTPISSPTDLSYQIGVAVGSVTKQLIDLKKQTFDLGGVTLGIGWNHDLTHKWSSALGGTLLFDVVNRQMIRQGLTGSIAYHLFGGARRLDHSGEIAQVIETNDFNFSVLVKSGLFHYAASDPKAPNNSLVGGLWEVAMGFEVRQETSDESALCATILTNVTTIPASVERLTSKINEIVVSWRLFL